ncbi:hypothetical protein QBC32DRAFT_326392 [Pseudoneurospora amorphoporcata]|uniref:Uncharacterized protein n=1 Tax=Pseudoneurospora amorphoporcata TaxID=241081 RepID=A0AAN6NSF5_9PEZI|nr:hypothetical protein QBC32DRAFT_326392 [Pseudoneurospora amorphoporcata]
MSTHASANLNRFDANLASSTDEPADHTAADNSHTSTPTTTDIQAYAKAKKPELTDTEAVDTKPIDAVDAASSSTETALPTSSNIPWGKLSPDTSTKPVAEAACTAVTSTQSIPTIYPSRRPNIFRTRQKHVRFSVSGLSAVAPRSADPTTEELEAADEFPVADLQEFEEDVKNRMRQKTQRFPNKMRENAWKQDRVEDLGEVFAIED